MIVGHVWGNMACMGHMRGNMACMGLCGGIWRAWGYAGGLGSLQVNSSISPMRSPRYRFLERIAIRGVIYERVVVRGDMACKGVLTLRQPARSAFDGLLAATLYR